MRMQSKHIYKAWGGGVAPSNVHIHGNFVSGFETNVFTKVCCSCYVGTWLTYFYCIQRVSGSNLSDVTDVEYPVNERSLSVLILSGIYVL
jgi:hypothetical protein